MKNIEEMKLYKTSDGLFHKSYCDALEHQKEVNIKKLIKDQIEDNYFNGIREKDILELFYNIYDNLKEADKHLEQELIDRKYRYLKESETSPEPYEENEVLDKSEE